MWLFLQTNKKANTEIIKNPFKYNTFLMQFTNRMSFFSGKHSLS